MSGALLQRASIVVWSIVVWVALWSDASVANVVWGAVIGLVSIRVVPPKRAPREVRIRPAIFAYYLVYSAWLLVVSSSVVAWEVVTPRNRINQGIVEVPLRTRSVAVATLIANTVSLTPGTLTIDVRRDPLTLYVHIMHLRSIEQVREDIGKLEGVALRAFPASERGGQPADHAPTEEQP